MPALTALLLTAACASGIAILLRALPWSKRLLAQKPLICPACMGGWSSMIAIYIMQPADQSFSTLAALWFASTSLAALAFHQLYPPQIEIELPKDQS